MLRQDEEALKVSLTAKIDEWLDENDHIDRPFLGENAVEIMAQAAIAVLRGIADAQVSNRKSD